MAVKLQKEDIRGYIKAALSGLVIGTLLAFPVLSLITLAPNYSLASETKIYIAPPKWRNTGADSCYRNTLSGDLKSVYDQIEEAIRSYKNGVCFTNLVSMWDAHRILTYVLRDNPDIFWVDGYKYDLNFSPLPLACYGIKFEKLDWPVWKVVQQHTAYLHRAEVEAKKAYDTAKHELPDSPEWRVRYYAAGYIHDYVAERLTYKDNDVLDQTIIPAFQLEEKNRNAVCGGYARTFKLVMDAAGIPCAYIVGITSDDSAGTHAWNVFYDGNSLKYADTTWDDRASGIRSFKRFQWFTDETIRFSKQHIPEEPEITSQIPRIPA